MQLTVFENGTCTLSCARSTEDHFICERYKDQIIPSKRKSINVMARRFCTKEWQQQFPLLGVLTTSERLSTTHRNLLHTTNQRRISLCLKIHLWIFICSHKPSSCKSIGAMRCKAQKCNVTETSPGGIRLLISRRAVVWSHRSLLQLYTHNASCVSNQLKQSVNSSLIWWGWISYFDN